MNAPVTVPKRPFRLLAPAAGRVSALLAGAVWCAGAAEAVQDAGLDSTAAAAVASATGDLPRRLVARFDFEENAEFSIGVPIGFYRVLSKARVPTPAAPTGAADEDPTREDPNREDPTNGTRATGEAGATDPERPRTIAPGLPDFGDHRITRDGGRDGGFAIECIVDGASIVLATEPGRIPIEPGARLEVRASVRTAGLVHAGVRVSARFRDAGGHALPGVWSTSVVRSEEAWRALAVEPPVAPDEARSLELWLEVVQPSADHAGDEGAEGEPFRVTRTDVRGSAFFDDLEIWQLPTTRFEAERSGIVPPGAVARLLVGCDDPVAGRVRAAVRVRDASDGTVHAQEFELARERTVAVEVPALPTGWYEAEARFTSIDDGATVAVRRARFAVLPDDPFEPDEPPRFGASLARIDASAGAAVELARSAFVVLPVWDAATDTRDPDHEIDRLRPVVDRLLGRRVEAMFRVAGVPGPLARAHRIDPGDTLALWALPAASWQPALEPWLLSFGQVVDQWFLADRPLDPRRGDLDRRIDALAGAMGAAIAGPSVGVPWSPEEEVGAELDRTIRRGRHVVEVVADGAWGESGVATYEGLPNGPFGMARIVPLPAGVVDDRARAIDLALRAIDAWRAGFDAVSVEVGDQGPPEIPGPPLELAAWRQVSTRLCGRDFIAAIPVVDMEGAPLRALLADGPRGSVLVLWSESTGGPREVAVELGAHEVLATDLWGRSARIAPARGGHRLRVGREPVFVEGVEREMCLLHGSLRVEPAFVESRRAPQEAELVLSNPWPVAMAGTLAIVDSAGAGEGGMAIAPRAHRFEIAPGGEARLPVTLAIPRSLAAGPVEVLVEIEGEAREPFVARLRAQVETGHAGVRVEHRWRLARSVERGGVDLVLTLGITNLTEDAIDLEAFAAADGFLQSRKPVTNLAPGATATRTFHFADGARRLSGRDIRAGVHDAESDARLLQRIAIPPLLPPGAALAGADDGDE